MPKRLIILGAGPKAIATAAKAHVLRELGFETPEVHIVERRRVGAHWMGDSGFTNGRLRLSTAPEKDLGFPYRSSCWGHVSIDRRVDESMMRFSWQAYLTNVELYAEWIDRGRPAPEHRQWAAYLQWAAAQLDRSTHIHYGEAQQASLRDGRWSLQLEEANGMRRILHGDGLMLTGPGTAKQVTVGAPGDPRVLTVDQFWRDPARFRALARARIAVVGAGETAAAVVMELASNPSLHIDIVSPNGMTFSRGESYRENRVFSDPAAGRWSGLSESDRQAFIHRTDQGVFSLAAQRGVVARSHDLELELSYEDHHVAHRCDFAVLAMGHDHCRMLRDMLDEPSLERVLEQTGLSALTDHEAERRIDGYLRLEGLSPDLHLPMLARLSQGPGFANLSSLGRLSDVVLRPYVRVARRTDINPIVTLMPGEARADEPPSTAQVSSASGV
jgi:mycobactin lysine-N-oxygenase